MQENQHELKLRTTWTETTKRNWKQSKTSGTSVWRALGLESEWKIGAGVEAKLARARFSRELARCRRSSLLRARTLSLSLSLFLSLEEEESFIRRTKKGERERERERERRRAAIVKRSPGRFSGSRWQDNSRSLVSLDVHSAGRYASQQRQLPSAREELGDSSASQPASLFLSPMPSLAHFRSAPVDPQSSPPPFVCRSLLAPAACLLRPAESDTFARKHGARAIESLASFVFRASSLHVRVCVCVSEWWLLKIHRRQVLRTRCPLLSALRLYRSETTWR